MLCIAVQSTLGSSNVVVTATAAAVLRQLQLCWDICSIAGTIAALLGQLQLCQGAAALLRQLQLCWATEAVLRQLQVYNFDMCLRDSLQPCSIKHPSIHVILVLSMWRKNNVCIRKYWCACLSFETNDRRFHNVYYFCCLLWPETHWFGYKWCCSTSTKMIRRHPSAGKKKERKLFLDILVTTNSELVRNSKRILLTFHISLHGKFGIPLVPIHNHCNML